MFDTIIIGAGPAGYSAAIYAARREMKTMIIGSVPGGQVSLASEIENYPGFDKIQSFYLIMKMQEQVKNNDVEILNAEVKKIEKNNDHFVLYTSDKKYEARTVIIAMGMIPRRLAIQGETEFNGRGVSYCANCDGPFYRDKNIAVVGGGNAALDAAEILSKIGKQVYLIHRSEEFKAFEVLIDEVKSKNNIEIFLNSQIVKINGNEKVDSIDVKNNMNDTEKNIKVDGVFIEVGRIASTDLVGEFVERDSKNQILVDEKCKTRTPGMFACGDVTQVPFKQITIASGQGTIAALAAYQYLQLKEGKAANVFDRSKKQDN